MGDKEDINSNVVPAPGYTLASFNPSQCKGNYSATSNEVRTLAVARLMGRLLYLVQRACSPLLAVPNVTAHLSTASVPITVLMYNGPLLCGFNVPIKG